MLKRADLLKTKGYIDGKWVGGRKTFPVLNPFDGTLIAKVADLGKGETKQAVEAAGRAFPLWAALAASKRAALLHDLADLILKNRDDIAHLLTLEQGKPLAESKEEVQDAVLALKWMAEEGRRVHGYTAPSPDETRFTYTIRQPMGVIAGISPWNFPFYLSVKQMASLAAGCTLVLKPSDETPLCILALAHLAEEAGIPKGVLNVVTCKNPAEVGDVLTSHPLVKRICFTGSTNVGKMLLKAAAPTVKKMTLELGGNCPFIVFDDADLNKAIEGAFSLKFYNAGQCCNGINRILVHENIYDEFIKKCAQKAKKLTCGSGLKKVDLGPLINTAAKEKVNRLVKQAVLKGAQLVLDSSEKGLLCSPIILRDATPKMEIWEEEIFGPVMAVYRFKTEKEAIEMANDTRYGLAAYFYTEDQKRIYRVSQGLEAGTVGVNTTNVYSIALPFGGWKESGIGREGGVVESLHDYCELKAVSIAK